MTVLQYIGLGLIVLGMIEFVVFRRLARTQENIAKRMRLLTINSLFNVTLGTVLLVFAR